MFVPSKATILHADLDAFFASVEQRDDPRLRGRPVIVGMGVVLSASYEARAYGVRTAMGGRQARRLCPHALVVRPRMSAYSEASKAVFEVFDDTTPLVEGLSIDEAFLDVRGLEHISGEPTEIAVQLRSDVGEHVGLPITVGVARTKFLAKVASGVAKPDGLLVVPPERELAFLHPLPVERLWGVGPATAGKLHGRGIRTVGEVAQIAEEVLVSMLGRASGRHLYALAHNRDPRPVQVGRRRGSIGSQHALGRAATVVGRRRRRNDRDRRPRHPPAACRRTSRADSRAAAALRRLLAGDPLAHAAPADLPHADDPGDVRWLLTAAMPMIERGGSRSSGWPSPTSRTTLLSSSHCRSILTAAPTSTRHSTRSATGSDPTRSRGRCCSAASFARRCRYSRISRVASSRAENAGRLETEYSGLLVVDRRDVLVIRVRLNNNDQTWHLYQTLRGHCEVEMVPDSEGPVLEISGPSRLELCGNPSPARRVAERVRSRVDHARARRASVRDEQGGPRPARGSRRRRLLALDLRSCHRLRPPRRPPAPAEPRCRHRPRRQARSGGETGR